jgi:hypothetical protein
LLFPFWETLDTCERGDATDFSLISLLILVLDLSAYCAVDPLADELPGSNNGWNVTSFAPALLVSVEMFVVLIPIPVCAINFCLSRSSINYKYINRIKRLINQQYIWK